MSKVVLPRLNQTGSNEWADVEANDVAIREVVNGQLDSENLKSGAGIDRSRLAAEAKPLTWYAAKSIATEQSRESTSFGLLATPDEIPGVVIPENSVLMVSYQAHWKESEGQRSRAALFIGANQLKTVYGNSAVAVAEEARMSTGSTANVFEDLLTIPLGLAGTSTGTAKEAYPSTGLAMGSLMSQSNADVFAYVLGGTTFNTPNSSPTTESINTPLGGYCPIVRIAPGTYNISVQYKALAGSVTAKERLLTAFVLGY